MVSQSRKIRKFGGKKSGRAGILHDVVATPSDELPKFSSPPPLSVSICGKNTVLVDSF